VETQQAGKDLTGAVVICELWKLAMAIHIINCNYELCFKDVKKSNIQSKTPSTVTHICYSMIKSRKMRSFGRET
jgi:hypothetical protein